MSLSHSHSILQGPSSAPLFILAHGAGAGMEHEFFQRLVPLLTDDLAVLRFNFPYMQQMIDEQKRRPPNRLEQLIEDYQSVIPSWDGPIVIGGKSMGGRVATHVALNHPQEGVVGSIVLGFPFHPPRKPERSKGEHLRDLTLPLLILQGERDTLGARHEISSEQLSSTGKVCWVSDGDHSLKPRKKSGLTWDDNLQFAAQQIKEFIRCLTQ